MEYRIKTPRRVIRVMKNFINAAYGERSVEMVSVGTFCAYVGDTGTTYRIGYDKRNIACNSEVEDAYFSTYIHNRYPISQGFANITLALLHELGHICTNDDVITYWDDLKRIARIQEIDRQYESSQERNFAYFQMPDERAATDWAIAWLQNPEHRRIAKAFEKEFFACLKKIKNGA